MARSILGKLGGVVAVFACLSTDAFAQYKPGGGLGSNVARFGTAPQTPPTPGAGPANSRSSIGWGLGNSPAPGWNGGGNARNRCGNQDFGRNTVVFFGGGFYPGFGYGNYGYPYGASSYDPYANQIQGQNEFLQQQIAELRSQNELLREGKAAGSGNIPAKKAKNQAVASRDKRFQQETRAQKYVAAGTRLFNAGTYHRAVDQFRLAIKQVEDDPTTHFYLAQSLFAVGKYHEAAQAIKDGLRLNPEWLEVEFDVRTLYGNRAELLAQLGALGKELNANTLDRNLLFLMGFELFIAGERERARTILEQVVRLEADDRHLKPFFDYFERQEAVRANDADIPRPAQLAKPDAG